MDRLLNHRPVTRESKKKLREDINANAAKTTHHETRIEIVEAALVSLHGTVQTLVKENADLKKRQQPSIVIAKKPQRCTMCGKEGHNARNSAFHPAKLVHVPGGLTVAHV